MSTGKKIGAGCGGCLGLLLILFMFAGCLSVLSGDASSGQGGDASVREESTEPEEDASEQTEEAPEDEPREEEEAAESEPEPEPEVSATIGNGIHQVGDDIEPGTYSTGGPDPDDLFPFCYYARLSGLSGELDDIISNNNIEGPGTVVVAEGDVALELSGGCEWTLQ
ncbi:hypothetical protein [Nocardiopsis metallicus]|uniref:Uncharacterized protein n=2 Tax=Nocardiopsis metallicus TaxID=179819 RepID=A0A840WGE0_9ACTN|nr:hypothetical protein [Nocardiopsis metallicus]MBB5490787.1 hypothetical protein [Nocardiopsis metallicus]